MSEDKTSEYFDDFEIITEANEINLSESTFLEQNESKNMETAAEMSAQDRPKPPPRNRETNKEPDIHGKREAQWLNKEEKLLDKIKNLEESLKQKNEELDSTNEEVCVLENEKEELQKVCDELEAKNTELASEKERACEVLQEKSEETIRETQAVDDLQKRLDEALNDVQASRSSESDKIACIQRLNDELQSVTEQKNRAIGELESRNMEIQEARAMGEEKLNKERELYDELSAIHDDMEKELREHKTKVCELKRENQQLLQEKNEMERQIQVTNKDFEKQIEKLSNNARVERKEKDTLENELVTTKLEEKRLTSENTKLVEERDFLKTKCKDLETGFKFNADNEISQLNQALQALNEENEILRKRNIKLETEVAELRMVKTDLEAKVRKAYLGQDNGGFIASRNVEPNTQKSPERGTPPRATPRTTPPRNPRPRDTPGEQWYETDHGGSLFAQIHREMNKKFSKVEINRYRSTQNIALSVTTDQQEEFKIGFPRNFPAAAVEVTYDGKTTKKTLKSNMNAPLQLCKELIDMLCEMVYGQSLE